MTDFDVTKPDGALPVNQGDNDIRANMTAITERMEKEHVWPANPLTSASGRHKFGIGTTATRDATLTVLVAGMLWFNTDAALGTGVLQIYNGSTWVSVADFIANDSVDDISATNGDQDTILSPGTYAARALAIDLVQELRQLRYAIARHAVGVGSVTRNSGASVVNWIEKPARPDNNQVLGARFSASNGVASPNPIIFGWTKLGSPTTYETVNRTVAAGFGRELHVVTGAAVDRGARQTITGLRADTLYLIRVRARITGVNPLRAITTGGSGAVWGNFQADWTETVDTDKMGVILTTGVPASIVLDLKNASGVNTEFFVSEVDMVPLGDAPWAASDIHYCNDKQTTFEHTVAAGAFADVEASVGVPMETDLIFAPGPGYEIKIDAMVSAECPSNPRSAAVRLMQSINLGAYTQIGTVGLLFSDGAADRGASCSLAAVVYPNANDSHKFKLQIFPFTNDFNVNPVSAGLTIGSNIRTEVSKRRA